MNQSIKELNYRLIFRIEVPDKIGTNHRLARISNTLESRTRSRTRKGAVRSRKRVVVKQRRKGVNPLRPRGRFFSLSRQTPPTPRGWTSGSNSLPPWHRVSPLPQRSASSFASFLFPPPALSLSVPDRPARILNRDHYLRAIIIPKTNSYFLLRNRKLINQSSLLTGPTCFWLLRESCDASPGVGVRRQWTRVHLRDSNGRNFLWEFVIMGSLLALQPGPSLDCLLCGPCDHKNPPIKLKSETHPTFCRCSLRRGDIALRFLCNKSPRSLVQFRA